MPNRELENGAPYLSGKADRPNFGKVLGWGAAAVVGAGAAYMGLKGVAEAYEFVDDNQVLVGAGSALVGGAILKNSEKFQKRRRSDARNGGLALLGIGIALVGTEVMNSRDDNGDAWQEQDPSTQEQSGQPSSDQVVTTDESGNVITITIPKIEGLPCTDFQPETVQPGDTFMGIIQYQQGYDSNQWSTLLENAPEIGAVDTIYPNQVIDVNCEA